MENSDNGKMEAALEKLLARATDPIIPAGAEDRLMATIRGTVQRPNVIALRPRPRLNRWAIGVPLAASLLLGIYLGTKESFDRYLPDSVMGLSLAGATDDDISSGLDDVETYSDGELT